MGSCDKSGNEQLASSCAIKTERTLSLSHTHTTLCDEMTRRVKATKGTEKGKGDMVELIITILIRTISEIDIHTQSQIK